MTGKQRYEEMNDDLNKAEAIAQEEGGPQDRSSASRAKEPVEGKMENELEINKANKPKAEKPEDVAGRENKGSMTKMMDKLTPMPDKNPKVGS